jgi:hypothetical protein
MDEASKFIIDVGIADLRYLEGFRKYPDITIGSIQGFDYFYAPEILKDPLRFILSNILYPLMQKAVYEKIPAVLDIIEHSDEVKCINDEIVFDLKEYLLNAEVPFARSIIENTDLKEYVKLPENLDKKIEELSNIPLCPDYKVNLFSLLKVLT